MLNNVVGGSRKPKNQPYGTEHVDAFILKKKLLGRSHKNKKETQKKSRTRSWSFGLLWAGWAHWFLRGNISLESTKDSDSMIISYDCEKRMDLRKYEFQYIAIFWRGAKYKIWYMKYEFQYVTIFWRGLKELVPLPTQFHEDDKFLHSSKGIVGPHTNILRKVGEIGKM